MFDYAENDFNLGFGSFMEPRDLGTRMPQNGVYALVTRRRSPGGKKFTWEKLFIYRPVTPPEISCTSSETPCIVFRSGLVIFLSLKNSNVTGIEP